MKTAWILPGGASLGAIQVGQAEALLSAGLAPDLVIGTSAGALNAAWLAADPTERGAAALRRLWASARRRDVFPLRPASLLLGLLGRRDHLMPSDSLTRWLEARLPYRHLEEAHIPLTVTTTDLDSGEPVLFSSGPAIPALVASCAIPGLFPPVSFAGRVLVDGGLSLDTPIRLAVEAGADRVFVLPTLARTDAGRPRAASQVALRAVNLLLGNAREAAMGPWADRAEIEMLPAPWLPEASPFSFRYVERLMDDARRLSEAWLEVGSGPRPGIRPGLSADAGHLGRRRAVSDLSARRPD